MNCFECKKRSVYFIIRSFEEVKDKVYPWWNPGFEKVYTFVYENCEEFDKMSDS